ATQVPWSFAITGGAGLVSVLRSSDLVRQHIPVAVWLVTRPLAVAHTVVPFPPLARGLEPVDIVLAALVLRRPGALGAAWLALGRGLVPRGAAAWTVAVGVAVSWVIDPAQQWRIGMLDALFLGVLVLLVDATSRASPARARRLLAAHLGLAVVFVPIVIAVAWLAGPGDPNLLLKRAYGARFLVDVVGPLPGAAMLAASGLLLA